MKFGISDNSCMFAADSRQESILTNEEAAFFMLLSDVTYLKYKLLKSLRIAVLRCMQLVLGGIREASSFLYFINFKFHTQMPRASENLSKGSVASLSSTPTSAKTVKPRKLTKLEKSIQIMQERVKELRDGYEYERLEHCKCLFFIARNFPNSFVSFIKEFGEDADWEKLCNKELEITNSKKA